MEPGEGLEGWDRQYAAGAFERYQGHLHVMRLDLTRTQWDEGLALLAAAGLVGSDAATSLYQLLYRLTPYWRVVNGWTNTQDPPAEDFEGWGAFRADLMLETRGMDRDEVVRFLATAFGTDAVRAAAVLLFQAG